MSSDRMPSDRTPADGLIRRLGLAPHPEGGWYRELYRSPQQVAAAQGTRSALTTIYYLLRQQQRSRWHCVSAAEAWHFYAGAPLELFAYDPTDTRLVRHVLSAPGGGGEPVGVVPAGVWQAARSLGEYSLMGCSVGPGFDFADFQLVASLPGHAKHFTGALHPLGELL